jgi:hypothetical protein
MDTDELSDKTYKAIISEAENFNSDLTLQFGLLSGECENEAAFIKKSSMLIRKIMKYQEYELDDLFFGNPPPKKELHSALNKIQHNILFLSGKQPK